MNRLLKKANARVSLGGAAFLLIAASVIGQLLGFLRTRMVNANFLATGPNSTDAYFAAFKIPDFFFFTLAAGALGVAFMPILADHIEKGDKKGSWQLSASLMNLLGIIMAVVGLIIVIFAQPLIKYIVAPDLTPEQMHNAVWIMRLIAFNPLLFTLSGILTSVQQLYGRFFFYAVAPLFYNLSIIVSIFVLHNFGLIGLGIGALIGAVLQLLVVFFGLAGLKFRYYPKIMWRSKDFHHILRQLPPRSIDQGIDSLNSIVETNRARALGEGYLSYYENAYMLQQAPIALVGTAISTAAFPRLTNRLSQGRPDLFRKEFLKVLRVMIWISLPVVVIGYFARGYLARLIFSRNAPEIALILGFFAGAIFFRILYTIVSRYFYAYKDTLTPLFVSIFAIGLNVFLAITLSKSYGVTGLAMAQSIVAASEVVILLFIMILRDPHLFDKNFIGGLFRIVSVTGFTLLAAFITISFLPLNASDRGFVVLGTKLSIIVAVTFSVHIFVSWIFGLEEVQPVIGKLRKLIFRPVKIQ